MPPRLGKLPNGSLPPGFSVNTAQTLFDNLAKYPPKDGWIGERYLTETLGLTAGVVVSVLGGLRYSRIIDEDDNLIDPSLPQLLGNPKTRKEVFRTILQSTYPASLLEPSRLERMTLDAAIKYFEDNGVKSTSSSRIARLFMWMAEQAGYKLGEEIPKPMQRPNFTAIPILPLESEVEDDELGDVTQMQRDFLRKVTEDFRSGKPVDPELLREFNRLVASIKGEPVDE